MIISPCKFYGSMKPGPLLCRISARITGGGVLGGLAPLVQALPQTPIIGSRSAHHKAPWKLSDNSTTVQDRRKKSPREFLTRGEHRAMGNVAPVSLEATCSTAWPTHDCSESECVCGLMTWTNMKHGTMHTAHSTTDRRPSSTRRRCIYLVHWQTETRRWASTRLHALILPYAGLQIGWSDDTVMYDLHVVGHDVVLWEVNWRRFVTLLLARLHIVWGASIALIVGVCRRRL